MKLQPSYLVWISVTLVLLLNIFMFFMDQYKYSNSQKCLNLTCRKYSLIFALVILTLDLCNGFTITHINPLPYIPRFWYIPVSILATMVILLHYNESEIVVKDTSFQPLPEFFFTHNVRIIFRAFITLLYLIIFMSRYLTESLPTIEVQSKLERFVYSKFGGLHYNNKICFMLSWITIFTIPLAGFRLYQEITYHPTKYNLPLAWIR